MLSYKIGLSEFQVTVLQISFPGCETIELDLTDFYKDTNHLETLYDKVNDYVKILPEHTQREIYNIFHKVYVQDYKSRFEDPAIIEKMEVKIKQLAELLEYDNFKLWLNHRSSEIIYPDVIHDVYVHDQDMNTTVEKTYVKQEYTDLIVLILFIRMMTPAFLDFYNYIKKITPHYYYKLYMLFVRSMVADTPEILKLREYIDVNMQTLVGTSKNENVILFAGLSDDDILDSLLAEVVFNKLLTIDFFNKKCNIISFIFQTIRYKGNYTPSGGVTIRGKGVAASSAKEDISYFEDYRKTSEIPIGTVVEIQQSLSSVAQLVRTLGLENFDYAQYQKELDNIKQYLSFKLDNVQICLLGWFIGKIINPRALYYIENRKLVELMLFAKVVLLSSGYNYVAMLLSSRRTEDAGYMNITIKNSMSKATVRKLSRCYSFILEDEEKSVVERTILQMSLNVYNAAWCVIGTPEQIKTVSTTNGYLVHPTNLNELILDYVEFATA